MRRMLALFLVVTLAALPLVAHAQTTFFPTPIAPGGGLAYSNASVSVTNTTTETSVWQYVITPSLVATSSSVGAAGTPIYTGASPAELSTTPLYTTPTGLHLRMNGTLAGAAGTTVNLGINFGQVNGSGSTLGLASVALNNNVGVAVTTPTPITVDVWVSPIASSSATPTSANALGIIGQQDVFIYARAILTGTGVATITSAATVSSINLASPTALNVVARWAAAASTSALTFYNRILVIGQ